MTKNFVKNILLGACLALGALVFRPATAAAESFNATNVLSSATPVIANWPTNAAGWFTGGPISVVNYKEVGLDVQGFLVNTNASASTIGFLVCYSQSQNPPVVVNGTNALSNNQVVQLQNDWATNNLKWITVNVPAATTNWFHWSTNLVSPDLVLDSTYVGLCQITNNFTAGCLLTNTVGNNLFTLTKKLTRVSFP